MMAGFYERAGLNIEVYDIDRDLPGLPHAGDVEFFAHYAKEAPGPVLELGSGTGRVALPLAEAGFEVTGLERSEAMLRRAEARRGELEPGVAERVRFVAGDMSDFDLGRTFGLVVIAFRSFQMLLTPEAGRRCLERAYRHLAPGGRLVLNVFDPLLELLTPGRAAPPDPLDVRSVVHPVSGNVVQIAVVSRTNETLSQVLEETWRFTERAASGELVRVEDEVLRMRWWYRYELRYLMELCGFEVEAEYSDFEWSAPAYGKEQVWVARRAG